MFAADTLLQNRYRVIRPLGRGGMGAVYEALDERLSRTVALKETLAETDELRRAFEREARLLANLRHPALPKVLDHFSEGDGMFLVMEFIPGDDLSVMLEREGRPFAPARVVAFAYQLLDALEYLHGLNPPVLHRDIKPANLKLVGESHIILLDFGLAKGRAGQMALTESRSVLGYSPNYSPLEQMQGTGTDARSDLYSLGATLYHLLTNVKPVDALSRATAIINGQPDPLQPAHKINGEVSASVSAALMRALALNIDNRPKNAAEMRVELQNMLPRAASTVPIREDDETTRVSLPSSRVEANALNVSANVSANASTQRKRQVVIPVPEQTWVADKESSRTEAKRKTKGKWIIGVLLAAGLLGLTAALFILFSGRDRPRRTASNQPVAKSSPKPSQTPTPSPTPAVNANQQENVNASPRAATPDQLAARAKLAEKSIPYTDAAFTRAVEDGDTSAVELFLAAGMNPDAKDSQGRTALINAASKGSNNISEKLLNKGADVNAKDAVGSTALMRAAEGGHRETTQVLLERGADVNMTDNDGTTALIYAAAQGRTEIVRMLLRKGARLDARDAHGRDALAWAEKNDHTEAAELLRKAGATEP
jgi:serine/threonine protein kinase